MLNRTHPFGITVSSHWRYKILLESKMTGYTDIDQVSNRREEIRNWRTVEISFPDRHCLTCLDLLRLCFGVCSSSSNSTIWCPYPWIVKILLIFFSPLVTAFVLSRSLIAYIWFQPCDLPLAFIVIFALEHDCPVLKVNSMLNLTASILQSRTIPLKKW